MTDHAPMPEPAPTEPLRSLPRRHWDTPKVSLVVLGVFLLLVALMAYGPWWPLQHVLIGSKFLIFGVMAGVVMVMVHGGSRAYTSGHWNRIWGWALGAVAVIAGTLLAVRLLDGVIPDQLLLYIPRLVIVVLGIVALLGGIMRGEDKEAPGAGTGGTSAPVPTGDEWFRQTSRILQGRLLWSSEQAREQIRLARSDFDHAQSRREPGTPELEPAEVLGAPDAYADSLTARPRTAADPARTGRWYYLITAAVLGGWALYRTTGVGMGWLTAALWVFSLVALVMFIWASWIVYRDR